MQQHQRQQMFYQDECQGFNQQGHYGGSQQGGYYQPHPGQPPQQQSRSDFYRNGGGKGFRGSNNSLASSSDGGSWDCTVPQHNPKSDFGVSLGNIEVVAIETLLGVLGISLGF